MWSVVLHSWGLGVAGDCTHRPLHSGRGPSIRLSVTLVDHTKTVEVRIMKFSPYDSANRLVFGV